MSDAIQPYPRNSPPRRPLPRRSEGSGLPLRRVVFVLLLSVLVLGGTAYASHRLGYKRGHKEAITGAYAPFWEARDLVQEHYVERTKVDDQRMNQGAIRGMLQSLGD